MSFSKILLNSSPPPRVKTYARLNPAYKSPKITIYGPPVHRFSGASTGGGVWADQSMTGMNYFEMKIGGSGGYPVIAIGHKPGNSNIPDDGPCVAWPYHGFIKKMVIILVPTQELFQQMM